MRTSINGTPGFTSPRVLAIVAGTWAVTLALMSPAAQRALALAFQSPMSPITPPPTVSQAVPSPPPPAPTVVPQGTAPPIPVAGLVVAMGAVVVLALGILIVRRRSAK